MTGAITDCRYAVVGAGGIGSAATYWLSRLAGAGVVCLEQWQPGHDRGASEDHSRIIRLGYHATRYTALTRAAYEAWEQIEAESGTTLVHRTGMVNIADSAEGRDILQRYAAAMTDQDIDFELIDGADVMRRWPQFRIAPDLPALYQPDGGILDIRKGVAANLTLARARGAAVVPDARVTALEPTGENVLVRTTAGDYRAEQVLLCTGAWTAQLLEQQLGLRWPIRLTHEQVTYLATPRPQDFAPDRFPIWIWHGEEEFYGFPVYGEAATKAAKEVCGAPVDLASWDWAPDPERVRRVAEFTESILPGYAGPELYTRCCLYDMPPDRDFVIDRLPGQPRITVAIGAGHAAKFAALLGRILAELATEGSTRFPIQDFRADRPALTDPDYVATYRLGGVRAAT